MITRTKLSLDLQNQLAKRIQKQFPIVERPFLHLANEFSLTEKEILQQLEEWDHQKYLREISAVMEGEVLNYDSALVCGRILEKDLDNVVSILKEHPTITHLYLRIYEINLWFTIAVSKDIGIEKHLNALSNFTGYKYYPLRRTQTFKIGVNFDLNKKINITEKTDIPSNFNKFPQEELTEEVKQIIRAIQTPLPYIERPFEKLAKEFSLTEKKLLSFLNSSPYGCIRKYVATFNHRKLGVSYNAMTVWKVPEEELALKGNQLANFPEVSHCYARTILPEFPYNLYSMIHGPDEETVHNIIKNISNKLDITEYLILYSPIEYKKTRLKYFLKELEKWEFTNIH
ncbi:MAG: transcriptional regulator [Leptospiraceae bacterium]|nr:MAG: transcriptional regulator [Leptospiraceae bacterium]